ncbi:protein of unknown function DUF218 [Leptothrix cholodnii SP-6]|uniref:DUF218 domain-containing protein n=1 Tax=Leptothrix cholodnii (strain ATCC 51168 / LMG 8142 / SP-6) TaxID=395495 RepID=B1Y065_LEPCP|nr:YdcF family protein [Leptothrix cholodnii]ACB35346.1 protein of unknown function DUF218 [Leptothrix cholodnii SP-6]
MNWLVHLTEPATFVAVLLLLATLYRLRAAPRDRRSTGAGLWAGMLLVYLAFATPLGGNALLRPLEDRAREAAALCLADGPPPTTAIVLAGGVDAGASQPGDYQFLTEGSLRRTVAAAHWARADDTRRLLVSGGHGSIPEAVLMTRMLADLGIDSRRIRIDSASTNTAQSGRNIAAQLGPVQAGRVGVITSADHMPRALRELQSQGIATCAMPMDYRHVAPILPGHLVPQLTALGKSTRALHEYIGLLKHALLDRG